MRTPESAQAGRQRRRLVLAAIAVCAPWVLAADGPTTAPAADSTGRARDPLATKQQIVRDRMTQLEDRMFRLTEKLSQAEPEQAARLQAAMKQAQELLIRRNMDDAIELLEERKLTDAADRQAAALKGLENVLKLLLEEGDNTKARQSEIDRLQQYRNQVQDLLDTERKLKAQADAAPRLAATLATIRAAIGKLETLIQRQAAQTGQTAAAGAQAEGSAADKLGAEQKSIREETQDVGKMLQRPTTAPTVPAESGAEPSPADQPPAHAGGASRPDGQPSSPPGGQQPNPQGGEPSGQPGGQQSGQNQQSPGGQSPSPGDAQKNPDGTPKDEKREADIEAGIRQARGDVEQAAGEMQAAENELGRKDAPAAVPMQKKAQESLRRALQELKQQEQETHRQLDQAQAAKRQRELRERARELAERMRNHESPQQKGAEPGKQQSGGQQQGGQQQGGQQQGGQQQGGQQQGGQQQGGQQQGNQQPGNQQQNSQRPQAPTPGNENVERAGEHMDKAADELDQNQPKQAGPEQQQALEQLEQAQRELEQALDQLRREQQEEILRGLESRFRTMLAAQLLINEGTLALEKQGPATWAHAEELKLASLAHDQTGVVDQAGQALHILREEGTTVVFPRIVEQMREDMTTVAELLVAKKTGVRTQRIQGDIVVALKELIDAVKEMRKQVQEGQTPGGQEGSGAGQNQNPPLLPGSAELKLLRSCQQRVSRQTSDFGTEHENPDALDVEAKAQLEQITHRQEEVAEMARKMHERLTGQ